MGASRSARDSAAQRQRQGNEAFSRHVGALQSNYKFVGLQT